MLYYNDYSMSNMIVNALAVSTLHKLRFATAVLFYVLRSLTEKEQGQVRAQLIMVANKY